MFKMHETKALASFFAAGAVLVAMASLAHAQGFVPTQPALQFAGTENYEAGGKVFTRYRLSVVNFAAFPNEMFQWVGAGADPCRTFVTIHDERGRKIYGFTALLASQDLTQLWFAKQIGEQPPLAVYVELHDRLLNVKYRSNPVRLR
jgi:hypothetical protein